MCTLDEVIRERTVGIFQQWLGYFERIGSQ